MHYWPYLYAQSFLNNLLLFLCLLYKCFQWKFCIVSSLNNNFRRIVFIFKRLSPFECRTKKRYENLKHK